MMIYIKMFFIEVRYIESSLSGPALCRSSARPSRARHTLRTTLRRTVCLSGCLFDFVTDASAVVYASAVREPDTNQTQCCKCNYFVILNEVDELICI